MITQESAYIALAWHTAEASMIDKYLYDHCPKSPRP